jgi:predicted nucleic acid-binding Zn ribbon protein
MYSEAVLTKCPECKKNKLQRLFGTGAGVIFKGSGFYQTDYRSEAYKQAVKAEQETGKAGGNGTAEKGSTPAGNATADKAGGAVGSGGGGGKSEAKSPKSRK